MVNRWWTEIRNNFNSSQLRFETTFKRRYVSIPWDNTAFIIIWSNLILLSSSIIDHPTHLVAKIYNQNDVLTIRSTKTFLWVSWEYNEFWVTLCRPCTKTLPNKHTTQVLTSKTLKQRILLTGLKITRNQNHKPKNIFFFTENNNTGI